MTTSEEYLRNNSQKLLWALALAYLIFVIYGSLVPLRFVPMPLDQAIGRFKQIPFLDLGIGSRADWVANLLLFIPLSLLWGQIFLSKQRTLRRLLIQLILIVTFSALACSIEFTQIFFPQRTVSQNDIIAETVGGILGLVAQAFWGNQLQELIGSLWRNENQANRLNRLLHAYLLVLVVFSVLPLDLTISPVEIYHKWVEGKVVLFPFSGLKGSLFENLYETLTDIIIWIPPGIMWMLSRRQSLVRIALSGLFTGLVIETAQLFVYSRVSDVTDILLASIGALLGALFARTTEQLRLTTLQLKPIFWYSLCIVWMISVFGIFWFPFDFRTTNLSLTEALREITRVPFITYYYGTEFHAVNELLRKIGFFLPGGLLWALAISATQKNTAKTPLTVTGLALIGLAAFGIEIGQVFLPQKTADITDVFLEFLGGLLGLFVTQWIVSGQRDGENEQALNPQPSVTKHPQLTKMRFPSWKAHAFKLIGLFGTIGMVTHMPYVPYNIRELIEPGKAGLLSVMGLGLAVYWIVNGHLIFLQWAKRDRMLMLPLWLIAQGLVTWILIRGSVPMESIHDIVGSPVLKWPWEWEMFGRFLCLHGAIMLQSIGACLLISVINKQARVEIFITWLIWSAILSWPLYAVVVENAATDNLTELMRDSGTFLSSTTLAIGFLAFFTTGGALSNAIAIPTNRRSSIILVLVASLISTACFWMGSEEIIVKYGKVFSAWQFILSTDRQTYATGINLLLRFAIAYGLMSCLWAIVQTSPTKQFHRDGS